MNSKFLKGTVLGIYYLVFLFVLNKYNQWTSLRICQILHIVSIIYIYIMVWKKTVKLKLLILIVSTVPVILSFFIIGQWKLLLVMIISLISGFIIVSYIEYLLLHNRRKVREIIDFVLIAAFSFCIISMNYRILFLQSMQDYDSFYEISRIKNQNTELVVCMYEEADDGEYILFGKRIEDGHEKVFYLDKVENLDLDIVCQQDELSIGNVKVNYQKSIYDYRKK